MLKSHLGKATGLEERGDADKAILVIPHDLVDLLSGIFWDDERVLEHYYGSVIASMGYWSMDK